MELEQQSLIMCIQAAAKLILDQRAIIVGRVSEVLYWLKESDDVAEEALIKRHAALREGCASAIAKLL